jgi:hypothetical protein
LNISYVVNMIHIYSFNELLGVNLTISKLIIQLSKR